MYIMEVYAKVRHAYYNEKKSQRAISKEFGLNRRSVRKMVENSIPPGYELLQARNCPKLGQHFSWIDEVLYEDALSRLKCDRGETRYKS